MSIDPAFMGPLLILGVVLIAGSAGGWVARRLHMPSITGNIVAGILLAVTIFREVGVARELQPLSSFAIGLIAVTAGGHFSYRRIHNALRRIMFIAIFESFTAMASVFLFLRLLGIDVLVALMLGCLAASTAPATTVALIRENHAKGPFVKTLLASVSIDSSICILMFAFVHGLLAAFYSHGEVTLGFADGLRQTLWQLTGSGGLAILLGFVTSRLFDNHRYHDFSVLLVSILLGVGFSLYVGFSPLLTCLFYGVYLGNTSRRNEEQLGALEPIEPLLYTAFFTLAGATVHFDLLMSAGGLCLVYVGARILGKGVGAYAGAWLSGSSERIRNSIPLGFVPQAGVALGLVVILEGDSRISEEVSYLVGSVVLAAVTINEIIGPFFTRAALRRSREVDLDRPRLVEFLDEEFILTHLEAGDKWEALEKLVDFYARTHKVSESVKQHVLETVLERERESSTGIGKGAAIPHGRVDSGDAIEGVMALCPQGIDFEAYDGEPVRILMLIVTPKEHEQRHLEVLASMSQMMSNEQIRSRLISAIDANDAWEVVESEESRPFNYFLEEEEEGVNGG
jgi:Kef-type K+ transport system membrane component KefB/mannitol/fructose-specific phosphotransferase system IIA component (Ntr-type)